MKLCVCGAQYQPHDPLPNVCPDPEPERDPLDVLQDTMAPDEHPYVDELVLGGEG